MEKEIKVTTGINFADALVVGITLVFVAGKVFGKIAWSWLWVFSPLWISLGLVLAIFLVILLVLFIKEGLEELGERRRRRKKNTKLI